MYTELILIAAAVVFALCAAVLLAVLILRKRQINKIVDAINDYLQSGVLSDFSPRDNHIAQLQNAVFDLEERLELEKKNTVEKAKQNSRFISDISHQLKTPIAGMRLYCEMESSKNPTPYTQKQLALIEKMENLISRLLTLEKIRSDSYEMEFRTYPAAEFINSLVADFKQIFLDREYRVDASGSLRCDAEWLGEALGNVIKNASEHTPKGGIITVCVNNTQGSVEISVQDNGGGVPEKELSLLFTRFHKTENALPSSAGIGLAITKAVVEKHHGTVYAENKNGGLNVVICLPHIDGRISI